jgi:hypothetical protein
MTLEEMQQKWLEMDAKLDRSMRLNEQLLTESRLNGARSALGRLRVSLWIEWVLWIVLAGALTLFVYHHMNSPASAMSGVALFLYADASGVAVAVQVIKLRRVSCSQSIAEMQVQLEKLRMFRIRYISLAVLAGIILWASAAIVAAQALLGINLYALFGAAWVWSNIGFGVATAAIVVWAAKRFGPRLSAFSFAKGLADNIAGVSLKKAATALAAAKSFANIVEEDGA